MKKYFLFVTFVLLVSFGCGPRSLSLRDRVKKIRLDNGLTVLMVKREGAPVFSGYIRIKVGSIEDPPGLAGMAHFFEHMAFKGTPTIGNDVQNEFVKIYERNGGSDLNAQTSTDFTEYFVSVPASKLKLWATMESERLIHPVFREFLKERDVVIEERRMRYDNDPDGKLYEHFINQALAGTPYGKSVIGTPDEIRNLSFENVGAFRNRYYIPSRMVVALVGNFDEADALKLVKKYFGKIPAKEDPGLAVHSLAKPAPFPRTETVTGGDEPRFYIGYSRPAYPHPDDPVFDVIQELMCEGRTSRLFSALVKQKNSAAKVDCYSSLPGNRLDSVFAFYGVPIAGYSNKQVEEGILEELEKLKKEPVRGEELKKVKTKIDADLIWALKSNMGMASWLSYFETLTGDWSYFYTFQDLVKKVTPEDIQHVAQTYFVPDKQVTVYLEKK